jgi:DNA recombination protein RmuC
MDILTLVIGIAIGLVVGVAVSVAVFRKPPSSQIQPIDPAELAREREQLALTRERYAAAEATAARLREENSELKSQAKRDQDVLKALAPVQEKLTEVQAHVVRLEKEREGQYAKLNEQLRQARETDEKLLSSNHALTTALKSTSARGQWGEMQLRRVLEVSGLTNHVSFDEQVKLVHRDSEGSGRPDAVVHLPGDMHLAIDAKVPFDAYLKACAITDDPDGSLAKPFLAEHARALRTHIDHLAKRAYPRSLDHSPEFTVMFLPSEQLLTAALDADPSLMDFALQKNIAPATPSSLLAVLKTVGTIWQQTVVTEQAAELLELGKTFYERIGTLSGHVTSLGNSLERAVANYNKMIGSFEKNVLVSARRFELFDPEKIGFNVIDGANATVRPLTAPETTLPSAETTLESQG